MSKRHIWRVKKEYFRQLKSGEKSLEIRIGYGHIKAVRAGDTISFENYGKNEFGVARVARYLSSEDLLASEPVSQILPGFTKERALKALREIYPKDKEKLGVYAFELHPRDTNLPKRKIYLASDLMTTHLKLFSKVIAESYNITDWICDDYPKHHEHFWTKYVPGIFNGQRQIVACYIGNEIAGVAILKRDESEAKLSTLYVGDKFRGKGVASDILKESFKWLGTEKPLMSIAEHKLGMFSKLIEQYGWEQTQVLDGYYNGRSRECVFNGKLD